MINYKILIPILIIVGILSLLFMRNFERKEVSAADWSVDFKPESKEPFGTWVFQETLKKTYGEENIVSLKEGGFYNINSQSKDKGYLFIGEYFNPSRSQADSLRSFISAGNEAIIITEGWSFTTDSLLLYIEPINEHEASATCISLYKQPKDYVLETYYRHFDSMATSYNTTLNIDSDSILFAYDTISTIDRELPIAINMTIDEGQLFLHTQPYVFTNIGLEQEEISEYAIRTIPLLDIDTLYIDRESFLNKNQEDKQSPLQFVMSQPKLKWAYYIMTAGLLLFVISRGKRRQRVIPTLEQNENTSLEYIKAVSDLYRTQNQHHKLAKQLKLIFHQWVKKKYYILSGEAGYTKKLSKKSRIPEEEVERLINRLNAAQNNQRFDDTQLTNLHKDLEQFYKNSQ